MIETASWKLLTPIPNAMLHQCL